MTVLLGRLVDGAEGCMYVGMYVGMYWVNRGLSLVVRRGRRRVRRRTRLGLTPLSFQAEKTCTNA